MIDFFIQNKICRNEGYVSFCDKEQLYLVNVYFSMVKVYIWCYVINETKGSYQEDKLLFVGVGGYVV